MSDLHAHNWTRLATTLPDGTNSRFNDLLQVLRQVRFYAVSYDVDSLLVLGDVTHRRHFVQFDVYNALMRELEETREAIRGDAVMMVGNHDYEAVGVHSLVPFHYAGWHVVDTPTWRTEGLFIPWMSGDAVPQAASDPPPMRFREGRTNAFLHYALDGHVLDSEFALPSSLRLAHLERYESVVLGHVHRPVVEQEGRVTYVGAPLHFDFGDAGDRHCWLMDTNTGHLEPLPLAAPKFCTTRYPKVPVPSEPGFLRVVGVPRDRLVDVKEQAVRNGWLDAVTVETEVPIEAVRALASGMVVNEDVMARYVERQFPDLDEDGRRPILEFGVSCLKRV